MQVVQDAVKFLYDKIEKMSFKKLDFNLRNWMSISEFRNCYYDSSPYDLSLEPQTVQYHNIDDEGQNSIENQEVTSENLDTSETKNSVQNAF